MINLCYQYGLGKTWRWFERFGQSKTITLDGRTIHIGGEHEDHYDPDFFIYNGVNPGGFIMIHGQKKSIRLAFVDLIGQMVVLLYQIVKWMKFGKPLIQVSQ